MSITTTPQTADIELGPKCPICNQEIVGISASRPGEHYYTCGHKATNHILSDIVQTPHKTFQSRGSDLELLTGISAGILLNNNIQGQS